MCVCDGASYGFQSISSQTCCDSLSRCCVCVFTTRRRCGRIKSPDDDDVMTVVRLPRDLISFVSWLWCYSVLSLYGLGVHCVHKWPFPRRVQDPVLTWIRPNPIPVLVMGLELVPSLSW